jgi:hypothetical protein
MPVRVVVALPTVVRPLGGIRGDARHVSGLPRVHHYVRYTWAAGKNTATCDSRSALARCNAPQSGWCSCNGSRLCCSACAAKAQRQAYSLLQLSPKHVPVPT